MFVQLTTWEPLIFCPNAGYLIKDIIFKVIFKQNLDDCYKTLINNIEDLSTLGNGWIMDSCDFGDGADVTFFEWAPIESIADEEGFWIESTGINFNSKTCWNLGSLMGLSMRPLMELGFEYLVQAQKQAQAAAKSKNTKYRF